MSGLNDKGFTTKSVKDIQDSIDNRIKQFKHGIRTDKSSYSKLRDNFIPSLKGLWDFLEGIYNRFLFDEADGVNLDELGVIKGIPRSLLVDSSGDVIPNTYVQMSYRLDIGDNIPNGITFIEEDVPKESRVDLVFPDQNVPVTLLEDYVLNNENLTYALIGFSRKIPASFWGALPSPYSSLYNNLNSYSKGDYVYLTARSGAFYVAVKDNPLDNFPSYQEGANEDWAQIGVFTTFKEGTTYYENSLIEDSDRSVIWVCKTNGTTTPPSIDISNWDKVFFTIKLNGVKYTQELFSCRARNPSWVVSLSNKISPNYGGTSDLTLFSRGDPFTDSLGIAKTVVNNSDVKTSFSLDVSESDIDYVYGTHKFLKGFVDTSDISEDNLAKLEVNLNPTSPRDYATGYDVKVSLPSSGFAQYGGLALTELESEALITSELSDAAYRGNMNLLTGVNGCGALDNLRAKIISIPSVRFVRIYENFNSIPDSNGVPAKSFECVVDGGSSENIGKTILKAGIPCISTYGSSTVNVENIDGDNIPVNFTFVQSALYYCDVDFSINPEKYSEAPDYSELVKESIKKYFNKLTPGEDLIISRCVSQLYADVPNLFTAAVKFGTTSTTAPNNIPIPYRQKAATNPSLITVTEI